MNEEIYRVKDIHGPFSYDIESGKHYFTETLRFGNFKEVMDILREYGIIKFNDNEYEGIDSTTEWRILDRLRLREYINNSSLSYLLKSVNEQMEE